MHVRIFRGLPSRVIVYDKHVRGAA